MGVKGLKKVLSFFICIVFFSGCISTQGPGMLTDLDSTEKWTKSQQNTKSFSDDEVKLNYEKVRVYDDNKRVIKLEITDNKSKTKSVETYQYFSNNPSSALYSKPYTTMREITKIDDSGSSKNTKEEWSYQKFDVAIGKIETKKESKPKAVKKSNKKSAKKDVSPEETDEGETEQIVLESGVVVQTSYSYHKNSALIEKRVTGYKLITPASLRIVSDNYNNYSDASLNYTHEFEYEAFGMYAAPVSFKSGIVIICKLEWKRFKGAEGKYDFGYPEKYYSLKDWYVNPLCCLILSNPVISSITKTLAEPDLPGTNIRKRYFVSDDTFTELIKEKNKKNSNIEDRLLLNVDDIYLAKIYLAGSYENTYEWKINKNKALLTGFTESRYIAGKLKKVLRSSIDFDGDNRRTKEEWFRVDEDKKKETLVFSEVLKY